MKVTIELPVPSAENIEEQLCEQFTHLVSVCRQVLADYRKTYNCEVPVISLKLPSKFKKEKPVSESKAFIERLLKHHLDRVPTANVPSQRQGLKNLYEAGFTDEAYLLNLYDQHVKSFPATTWHTIRWLVGKQLTKDATKTPATDMEFKRVELTPDAEEALKARLAGLDTETKT